MKDFIAEQISQIRRGGYSVLTRKIKFVIKLVLVVILKSTLHVIALPVVLSLRIIRPWLLVRFGALVSSRIGHFAANTELYLCERDAGINWPIQQHVDLFYYGHMPICNYQLAKMWKRTLHVWPAWILAPIARINRMVPSGAVHEIGNNTQSDRDVHNLLDKFSPHLEFTAKEDAKGQANLQLMGIPLGAPFVCLAVRDSAYLKHHYGGDCSYHNYRDSDVQNYVLAAEALADRGYYVIRMGVKVHEAINSAHPKIIDYATNGMRNDFMDIYLGAKCAFCISVGTGFDAVPLIFRRPIAYVNMVPIGYLSTYVNQFVGILKHHFSIKSNKNLSLRDILINGVGFCMATSDYESKGILLIENTPEEIRDLVIEMDERLNKAWQPHEDDDSLQQRFWELFPTDAHDAYRGLPLHGEIRGRFGASFLRNNRWWLQ